MRFCMAVMKSSALTLSYEVLNQSIVSVKQRSTKSCTASYRAIGTGRNASEADPFDGPLSGHKRTCPYRYTLGVSDLSLRAWDR
jgi:hypothetical protein